MTPLILLLAPPMTFGSPRAVRTCSAVIPTLTALGSAPRLQPHNITAVPAKAIRRNMARIPISFLGEQPCTLCAFARGRRDSLQRHGLYRRRISLRRICVGRDER